MVVNFTAQIASCNILRGILACVSSWKNNHTKQQENKQTTSKQNNRETNNKKNGCRKASVITEIRIVYNISDVFTAINKAIPQKLTERFLKRNFEIMLPKQKNGLPEGYLYINDWHGINFPTPLPRFLKNAYLLHFMVCFVIRLNDVDQVRQQYTLYLLQSESLHIRLNLQSLVSKCNFPLVDSWKVYFSISQRFHRKYLNERKVKSSLDFCTSGRKEKSQVFRGKCTY